MHIILVCGDRYYDDVETIANVLGSFQRLHQDDGVKIIQGGCGGADTIALKYQNDFELEGETYMADWKKCGRAAGPIRNQEMIEKGHPDVILAFHKDIKKSKGTLDMLKRGQKNNIPTYLISGTADTIKKFENSDIE